MSPNGSASERKEVSKLREERDILQHRCDIVCLKQLTGVLLLSFVYDHRTEYSAYTDVPRVEAESFLGSSPV